MSARPDILAVDGGNSKVEALLANADGQVLGRGRAGGASFAPGAETMSVAALLEAVGGACAAARIAWHPALATRATVPALARIAVLCLAGDDLPSDDRRILAAVRPLGLGDELLLHNDTFAVLRSGTERSWGIGVVCGTGLNCSAVAPDGRTIRYASLGEISGDEGGGGWLGEQAVRAAVRGQDGRDPHTRLERDVPAHFGLESVLEVLEGMQAGYLGGRVLELAPVAFAAAAAGDAVAQGLIDHQADEIVLMVTSAVRRLGLESLDVDVVLGGGMLQGGEVGFLDRISAGIRAVAPAARVAPLDVPPVLGAALLGLDRLAAPSTGAPLADVSSAAARLRSTLADCTLAGSALATGHLRATQEV